MDINLRVVNILRSGGALAKLSPLAAKPSSGRRLKASQIGQERRFTRAHFWTLIFYYNGRIGLFSDYSRGRPSRLLRHVKGERLLGRPRNRERERERKWHGNYVLLEGQPSMCCGFRTKRVTPAASHGSLSAHAAGSLLHTHELNS